MQGRSGGGLFNADGQVIGVCNAADPSDNEGLYAALESVYRELDRARLSFVYRDVASVPTALETTVGQTFLSAAAQAMPAKNPATAADRDVYPTGAAGNSTVKGQLTTEEAATLAELHQKARDAEVICIVRPSTPGAKSEIIVIEKPSQAFLNQLSGEQQPRPARQLTSLETGGESR